MCHALFETEKVKGHMGCSAPQLLDSWIYVFLHTHTMITTQIIIYQHDNFYSSQFYSEKVYFLGKQ